MVSFGRIEKQQLVRVHHFLSQLLQRELAVVLGSHDADHAYKLEVRIHQVARIHRVLAADVLADVLLQQRNGQRLRDGDVLRVSPYASHLPISEPIC